MSLAKKLETDGASHLRKETGLEELAAVGRRSSPLLGNLLTYAGTHALLVDAAGPRRERKVRQLEVRKILEFSNLQSAFVAPFKVPTDEERAHDFLWRAHKGGARARVYRALQPLALRGHHH